MIKKGPRNVNVWVARPGCRLTRFTGPGMMACIGECFLTVVEGPL